MLQLLTLGFLLIISTTAQDSSQQQERDQALKHITEYVDKTVSPCDNFFHYACGNWKNTHKLPEGQLAANGFSKLTDTILGELKTMLEQGEPIYNAEVELKVKQFYKSCLNTDVIKSKGYEPIRKFMKSLVEMPVLNKDFDETKFNCLELENDFKTYGFDGILGMKVLNNNEKIYIGEIELPFTKQMYGDAGVMGKYQEKIVKFLHETFNVPLEEATKTASEIVEFEKQLSKIVADPEHRANINKYFVHTKVEELNKKYPKVEWEKFLTKATGTPIQGSQHIVEYNADYIPGLMEIVEKTPKKVIGNYMWWNVINRFLNVTEIPSGSPDDTWKFCIRKTKEYFPKEMGVMYSHKYYDDDVKKDVEEMFSDIKKSFRSGFEKYEWINEETKKVALQRLDNAKVVVTGYPKGTQVPIEKDFGTIDINPEEYYQNVLNKLQYNTKLFRTKVVTSDKTVNDYVQDPSGLNANYEVAENTLKISLGFLNPPFYTKQLPRNMKFAQLGAIMVHELLHGFDQIGQNIDINGVSINWWDDKSTQAFADKSKCFADQYSKFGAAPLTSNLADNGGIKYAFLTYKQWADSIKDTKKDAFALETFPGLDYTNTQLFFLTHAQTWCHYTKTKPDASDLTYPFEYRINLPMTNLEEFSKEFQCPEGSKMNPKDKCLLW